MLKKGINLSEMNIKLLQKIEELTLYLIEKDTDEKMLKENIKRLNKYMDLQQVEILELKQRITNIIKSSKRIE